MSMQVLAEATCAVCNIRTPTKVLKKVPTSKIPNIHLLKVSNELKNLILSAQWSVPQHSNNYSTEVAEHVQSNIYLP